MFRPHVTLTTLNKYRRPYGERLRPITGLGREARRDPLRAHNNVVASGCAVGPEHEFLVKVPRSKSQVSRPDDDDTQRMRNWRFRAH